MNEENFSDPLAELEKIEKLAEAMQNRSLKWNQKNKMALLVFIRKLIDNNPNINGSEKFLNVLSLNAIVRKLNSALVHTNYSIKMILVDLLSLIQEIKSSYIFRLDTFEEFSNYIIKHKLISTNKNQQYARIDYNYEQYKILKYGFTKNWDKQLVDVLIKKKKDTDEFELFKVDDKNRNAIYIFYRFYKDNLRSIKPDVFFDFNETEKELLMKIPIYSAQVDLFENEIKQMALEKIKDYYSKKFEKEISPYIVIKNIEEEFRTINSVITTIIFRFWDKNSEDGPEVKNKQGFNIKL